jgi:hypothetical protein
MTGNFAFTQFSSSIAYWVTKGGHPQLYVVCNSAILRSTESIAGLRTKKSCGTEIADLHNWTSKIPQLSVSDSYWYFRNISLRRNVFLQGLSIAYLSVCPPICLSVCLSAYLSVRQPVCPPICLTVPPCLSLCPPACLLCSPACLSVCLSVSCLSPASLSVAYQSVCPLPVCLPPVSLSAFLPVCPPACLSVCLSVHLGICLPVSPVCL